MALRGYLSSLCLGILLTTCGAEHLSWKQVSNGIGHVVWHGRRSVRTRNLRLLGDTWDITHQASLATALSEKGSLLTCEDQQRRQTAILAKLDVRVQSVSHHDRPLGVVVVPAGATGGVQHNSTHAETHAPRTRRGAQAEADSLGPDALEHRARGLADAQRRAPAERAREGRRDCARAGEQPVRGRVRAVAVCREEDAVVAEEILERLGELRVVHGRVEPAEHRADRGVRRPVLEAERRERVVRGVLCARAA